MSDLRGSRHRLGVLTEYERARNMLANPPSATTISSFVSLANASGAYGKSHLNWLERDTARISSD